MAIAQPPSTMPSLAAKRVMAPSASSSPCILQNHVHNNQRPVDLKNNRKHSIVLTMDRNDRTSFSSIKEGDTGVAQTFTTTKTSSYLSKAYEIGAEDEEAIQDGFVTPLDVMSGVQVEEQQPTMLHGFVCPCDGFQGWKGISLNGKMASKSFSDLRALGHRWAWDSYKTSSPTIKDTMEKAADLQGGKVEGRYAPGKAPIELLPMELLGKF